MLALTEKEHKNYLNNIFKHPKINLFYVTCGTSRIESGSLWYESFTGTNQDDIPNPLVPLPVR